MKVGDNDMLKHHHVRTPGTTFHRLSIPDSESRETGPPLMLQEPLWPQEAVYQRRLVPVTSHAQGRSPGARPLSPLACHPMTETPLSLYITPVILYPHFVTLSATSQVKEKLSQIEENYAVKF